MNLQPTFRRAGQRVTTLTSAHQLLDTEPVADAFGLMVLADCAHLEAAHELHAELGMSTDQPAPEGHVNAQWS